MSTSKTEARKRLQVKNDKYRENYERIFGKPFYNATAMHIKHSKCMPPDMLACTTEKSCTLICNASFSDEFFCELQGIKPSELKENKK